jgi:hypothetical protein
MVNENEMCPKCDARNVTLLEFRFLFGSIAPVKMWTCGNRFCMHRWPNLVLTPALTIPASLSG